MGIEDILESNLLKCPNCEKLSLDGLTGNCYKCGNIQPSDTSLLEGNTFVVEGETLEAVEAVEKVIEEKYLGEIGLTLNEEDVSFDIYLTEETLSINNSESIVQLKIGEIGYKFYFNYKIKSEHTGDYNEKGIRCLSGVSFSKVEKLESGNWSNYNFKNYSNKEKIKHFIVREVLNNYEYNKYL